MATSERTLPARSADDHTPTSVCVTLVLYENSLTELWRCLRAIWHSVDYSLTQNLLSPANVRISIGDCSDRPLVGDDDLHAIRENLDPRVEVSYQWFAKNLGHSAGTNTLADAAPEDALLILNPDTYMAPSSLAALLGALRNPDVAAVDARQIPCEHPKWYDPTLGDQSWASGACLLVRTPRFHEVGGFDSDTFPSYVNDVDLSWRLRLHHGRVVHQPKAVVFHDKRLDKNGSVRPTRTELYQGVLGKLLLASKYAREDVVLETIEVVNAHGEAEHRRAVREFESRRRRRRLPEALKGSENVAEFLDGEYGRRLF